MDLIIVSDSIFLSPEEYHYNGCIGISEGKIVYVGQYDECLKKERAEILMCHGKTVIPGFIDSHTHVFLGALQNHFENLSDCQSAQSIAEKLKKSKYKPTPNGWIFGFGWSSHHWEDNTQPHKTILDTFFPETPIVLFNEEMHSIWVNSKALEICKIDDKTPDPIRGKVYRDEAKKPTGIFLEFEAMQMILGSALDLGSDYLRGIICDFLKICAGNGITCLSDIQLFMPDLLPIYGNLEAQGKLTAKINLSYPLDLGLVRINENKKKYSSNLIDINSVKIFLDGTPLSGNGFLVEPYENMPGFRSVPLIDFQALVEKILEASASGYQMRIHACGDGAVKMALDAFEKASEVIDIKALRHTIEHIELIAKEDIPRFGALGVIPSMQPEHLYWPSFDSHPFFEILGSARCSTTWPIKSLMNQNGYCGFGTDYPVVGINPMHGVHRAVFRRMDDGNPEEGWNPNERLSLQEALYCYTFGSAKMLHLESRCGSIHVGNDADLVVLDDDIFHIDSHQLRNTKPLLTLMNGKIVYGEFLRKEDQSPGTI